MKRLNTGGQTSVVIFPDSGSYDFALNAAEPPFNDRRVRQAIDLALDRKRFAETVMYGLTDPTHIIWLKSAGLECVHRCWRIQPGQGAPTAR